MAELFHDELDENGSPPLVYWDRTFYSSFPMQVDALKNSSTLYVGNLSFYTQETQIHELFSKVGPIKLITMGVNKATKTPCGFCFVEYYKRQDAYKCIKYISGTTCDDRLIRADLDAGFRPGRQYGRGKSGGQVRDDKRQEFDIGRGGLPAQQNLYQRTRMGDQVQQSQPSHQWPDSFRPGAPPPPFMQDFRRGRRRDRVPDIIHAPSLDAPLHTARAAPRRHSEPGPKRQRPVEPFTQGGGLSEHPEKRRREGDGDENENDHAGDEA